MVSGERIWSPQSILHYCYIKSCNLAGDISSHPISSGETEQIFGEQDSPMLVQRNYPRCISLISYQQLSYIDHRSHSWFTAKACKTIVRTQLGILRINEGVPNAIRKRLNQMIWSLRQTGHLYWNRHKIWIKLIGHLYAFLLSKCSTARSNMAHRGELRFSEFNQVPAQCPGEMRRETK